MKPLYVLLTVFIVLALAGFLIMHTVPWVMAGNIAMAAMLCFTALGHFLFTKGMSLMLPPFIPARTLLVQVTGVLEIVLAIGFCIASTRHLTAVVTIVFFALLLPANIYA